MANEKDTHQIEQVSNESEEVAEAALVSVRFVGVSWARVEGDRVKVYRKNAKLKVTQEEFDKLSVGIRPTLVKDNSED